MSEPTRQLQLDQIHGSSCIGRRTWLAGSLAKPIPSTSRSATSAMTTSRTSFGFCAPPTQGFSKGATQSGSFGVQVQGRHET